MTSHVEIPQPVVEQYFADRARAEGAAFTAFCAEHDYVRDLFEFTDEQRAEWNTVYDGVAAEWDAKRKQIEADYAPADEKTPEAAASGVSVGS